MDDFAWDRENRRKLNPTTLRDATAGELALAPDAELQALVEGLYPEASEYTRQLAQQELDYRRLRS
jgi:hypothetical protein